MRILYTGGSSGGHIFPIIALNRALKEKALKSNIQLEAYFCGAAAFDPDFFKKEGIASYFIARAKFRRYFSLLNLLDPFKFIIAFIKSLFIVWKIMPDIVFAKGGYDSVPVGFAAWIYRIPIITHESDSIPGLANKILSKFAVRIAVSFSYSLQFFPAAKTAFMGNIIREKPANIQDIKKELNISQPLILVLGGSLGAVALNELMAKSLSHLLGDYFIVLQCGKNNFDQFSEELSLVYQVELNTTKNFKLFPFLDEQELAAYFSAADLVISRAGAGSIFEIARWAKPSILIPLNGSASQHQQKNAFLYARSGAAVVLEQNNLTPELLISEIRNILNNLALKEKMSKAAGAFINENAAVILADEIFNVLRIVQPQAQNMTTDSNALNNQQTIQDSSQHLQSNISAGDRIYSK